MGPEEGPSEADRDFKAPITGKGRFSKLEMVPPGLSGKDLEDWKAEQARNDAESKQKAREKREEELFEENYGPKSYF